MRTRLLKPGFFANAELAELPPLARLLFAGLWLLADKLGRLFDRPKQIKAQLLPFDRCDVEKLLQLLHEARFITRYEVDNVKCIQINTFTRHQSITTWEKKDTTSEIPAPPLQKDFRSPSTGLRIDIDRKIDVDIDVDVDAATSEVPPKPKRSKRPVAPLPDDFIPEELDVKYTNGFMKAELSRELDKFLDYHRARSSLFADWNAAWRYWMGNARKFKERDKPHGSNNGNTDTGKTGHRSGEGSGKDAGYDPWVDSKKL